MKFIGGYWYTVLVAVLVFAVEKLGELFSGAQFADKPYAPLLVMLVGLVLQAIKIYLVKRASGDRVRAAVLKGAKVLPVPVVNYWRLFWAG